MKRFIASLFLIAVAAVSQAQISPTAIITGNALGIVGASTTPYPITLSAQVVGCGPQVPLIIGGIGGSVITNTYKTAPLVGPSFIATLTVYGNDVISCGGQTYTMYAVTWLINNQPAAPTASYRVVQGQTCNISDGTCLPVGFVPPVIGAGAGLICPPATPLLSGFNANYTPVCLVGPIVSVPNALQTTPTLSQTLTQPVNTNLIFNLSGTGIFTVNGSQVLTVASALTQFVGFNPSAAQTVTEPINQNFNFITLGTGAVRWNGANVLTTATGMGIGSGVLFAPSATQTITQPVNTNFAIITPGTGVLSHNGNNVLDTSTGVQYAPAGGQVVVQPAATSLDVNVLNHEVNATQFSGADMGTQVNNAIAFLTTNYGAGTVVIPAGTYTYATQIVKPRKILLRGQGVSSELDYTGSAAAIQIVDSLGPDATFDFLGGIRDLYIHGPSSSSGVAIYFGCNLGGGSCTNVYGDSQYIQNVVIERFHFGVEFGSNAFLLHFLNTSFANEMGIDIITDPSNAANSGENIEFVGGKFSNSQVANTTWPLHFYASSFDVEPSAATPTFFNTSISCVNCHYEALSGLGPMFSTNLGNVLVYISGEIQYDQTTGTIPEVILSNGSFNSMYLVGANVAVTPAQATSFINATSAATTHNITIFGLQGSGIGSPLFQGGFNEQQSGINVLLNSNWGSNSVLNVLGNIQGTTFKVGSTAGVSCTGTPTASFASINGIVTHC